MSHFINIFYPGLPGTYFRTWSRRGRLSRRNQQVYLWETPEIKI